MYKVDEHKTEKGGKVLKTKSGVFSIYLDKGEIVVVPVIAGGIDTPPAEPPTPPVEPPPAPAGNDDLNPQPNVITQDKVQEIVNKTYTKAYAKASEENANKIQALEAKIVELGKGSDGKGDLDGEGKKDLTLLKAENTKQADTIATLRKENLTAKISGAIDGFDVYDRSQVISLVSGHVKYDENGKITINSDSGVFVNAQGQEGTLSEYVADFLSKNGNLVKAASSKGSGGGKPEDTGTAPSISKEEFENKSEVEKREFLDSGGEIIKPGS